MENRRIQDTKGGYMKYTEVLAIYFSRKKEQEFNNRMLQNGYQEVEFDVNDYVNTICSIPLEYMVEYIETNGVDYIITSKDVYQFSNFNNATEGVCSVLSENNNKGLTYKELGEELQSDGKSRSDYAKTKYGENHFKVAEDFGLSFHIKAHNCYLSSLGYVYLKLDTEQKHRLMTRLILRSKLITRLYRESKKGPVPLELLLYDLAESTYRRRKSNVRTVIKELQKTKEYDFVYFADSIIY